MDKRLGFEDWDDQSSLDLQQLVDAVCSDELQNLSFSVTIADPTREDCPLVACSKGFTELTGYTVQEIVGRNCRFLLDNVPEHMIDQESRIKVRMYIEKTKDYKAEQMVEELRQLRLHAKNLRMCLSSGELLCVQVNCRKSGEFFRNMFYLKEVKLNGKPFILGLQAGLPEDFDDADGATLEECCQQAFDQLTRNMSAFEVVLARQFWYSGTMRRQGNRRTLTLPSLNRLVPVAGLGPLLLKPRSLLQIVRQATLQEECLARMESPAAVLQDKDFSKQTTNSSQVSTAFVEPHVDPLAWEAGSIRAPEKLHTAFCPAWVQRWDPQRYVEVHKIQDAFRNQGTVCLMRDKESGELVAVKKMPNEWVQDSHTAFVEAHPKETEQPWQDIGANSFLDSISFPFGSGLIGVYKDDTHTWVVSTFCPGGDLFGWASAMGISPGSIRENMVKPVFMYLARSVQQLHELGLAHRDISAENVLIAGGETQIKVIDFGVAATSRFITAGGLVGKPSYQAPETNVSGYDAFLADAFALGVTLYACCVMDYPWLDTHGRGDKCVQFVRMKGFRSFIQRRKLPTGNQKVADVMSEELMQLLEGLLSFDPDTRLTLGECNLWPQGRRSIWEEPWLQ
mmetsp:Transcript_47964/g.111931  ORF Transcript_47964/g.111931 Transcript_47964/m.111931 type:complete len:623 (+) Transcript_47964:86-1954(+)